MNKIIVFWAATIAFVFPATLRAAHSADSFMTGISPQTEVVQFCLSPPVQFCLSPDNPVGNAADSHHSRPVAFGSGRLRMRTAGQRLGERAGCNCQAA
ncbi:MAG: hypothetical protein JO288_19180 [Hyphomicrobiales bacterium]|nr:hypothetical protein [Hyphomicrobiales bacterium]